MTYFERFIAMSEQLRGAGANHNRYNSHVGCHLDQAVMRHVRTWWMDIKKSGFCSKVGDSEISILDQQPTSLECNHV